VGRRTALLIAAVVVAALGAGLVYAYVKGVDDRALKDQNPQQVLVATALIPAGQSAGDAAKAGSLELRKIAGAAVAPGALSDIRNVSGLVAVSPIYPGEQILAAKFAASRTGGDLPIPAGKLAISLQLSDPARVAGFVTPGSDVAVLATVTSAIPGRTGIKVPFTEVVLARVPVIATGPTTVITSTKASGGTTNTEQVPKAILTVAVTQAEAERLVLAQTVGELYFGLLTDASKTTQGQRTDVSSLFR
jgi:pilus assembly protein CpaB